MAEKERIEEHWSDRRRRRIRCKIHGLHYDPDMTLGCALCRKEGLLQEEARRSRPQLVIMLLALLGVAVSAYRIFGPGMGLGGGIGAAENDTPAFEAIALSRLIPAAHRGAIQAADGAIFSPTALNLPSIGRNIDVAFEALGRSLRDEATPEARRAAAEITALREDRDLWLTPRAITVLRRQWLDFRSRTFEPAPWFHFVAVETGLDRVTTAAYRDAADELLGLIEDGAARARRLAGLAGPYDSSAAAQPQIRQEWTSFIADWRQRINEISRRLPSRPGSGAEAGLLLATQRFEEALAVTWALASSGAPPASDAFDRAFDLATEARRSFEDLAG